MKPLRPLVPVDATHVRDGGRLLWHASGCNYLGLLDHPQVRAACATATAHGPLHPGASRATTGEHALYLRAERALARFLGLKTALLLPSGYMASLVAMQSMTALATHVALHPDAHSCLRDGTRLSGLRGIRGWDGTPAGLRRAVARLPATSRVVLALDGVAPAAGHVADLPAFLAALPPMGWLMVDDAHGVGVLGRRGGGSIEHHGIRDPRVVVTGSLSKAMGVHGGFVAGPEAVIASARGAPVFVGTTSPPLSMPAGLMAVLGILRHEPGRVRALQERAAWLHRQLAGVPGVCSDPSSPVVALHPPDKAMARRLGAALSRAGILPSFIRYPSGPRDGFFRFAASAMHEWSDLGRLAAVIRGAAGPGRLDGGGDA